MLIVLTNYGAGGKVQTPATVQEVSALPGAFGLPVIVAIAAAVERSVIVLQAPKVGGGGGIAGLSEKPTTAMLAYALVSIIQARLAERMV